MAASSKFDISASPDRPLGSTGQRGSFGSASFDRSGSFRESMGSPMLSSLPSMSRSSSAVTQDDVTNFFQRLQFDPKPIAADCKLYRQGELKRTLSAVLGFPQDDSPSASLKGKLLSSSSDELKKAKSGLRESVSKARERVKIFSEALSVLNKCFPGIPSRKRSRVELASGDRASLGPSNDRPGFSPSLGKMGTSSPALDNDFEVPQQRPEERTKSSVISKRTRTSLLDARANSNARLSMVVDKDRDVLRLPGSGVAVTEDRPLSIGSDGWEKSKMRKKRSGIKPDVSPSKLTHKPVEGYRESKHGMQQRLAADIRSRLNDTHGFRPGMGNEVSGIGKADGVLQQNGSTVRSPFGRGDQENSAVAWDKKDRSSDKERVNLKTANQNSAREDYSSASPTTSNTKVPSSARAPRSGIGALPKSSPTVHRQSASSDWDIPQGTERPSASTGPSNRKRPPSVRSSSPPVAHWAGQRPQKISRTARRTNFLPIVSNNDESPALDNISDAVGNNNGSASRRFPSSSPQHVKLQGDSMSESEESGIAETKFKDKKKMFDEVDDKAGNIFQKGSPILPPPRKNKLINGEDLGDGVRRQGRTGRGSTSTRAPTTFEKRGNIGTPKQLRTSKIGYERSERAGRPPTRKISDRKAYTRLKHSAVPVAVEFAGPCDPQSELLTAANAVFNPTHESSFWRLMEPMLGFISELDTAFLKQQEECMSLFLATPALTDADRLVNLSNGFGSLEYEKHSGFSPATESVDHFLELLTLETRGPDAIPLCQRLLAALITEEDIESYGHGTNEGILADDFGDGFQPHNESEHGTLGYELMGNSHSVGGTTLNGFRITAMRRTPGEPEGYDEPEAVSQLGGIQNSGTIFNYGRSVNGFSEADTMPNMVSPDFHYDSLSLDERLLLEINGIGIYPEQLEVKGADNDEISQDIRKLAGSYLGQASQKKNFVHKLLKLASATRENQEKECEQSALDKLVIMAYGKYMGWDSSTTGKSNTSKVVRQAALPFVRRVLDNYRRYDTTGISCFNGPMFKDIFHSGPTRLAEARSVDAIMEGESAKPYPTLSFQQIDENMENQDVYSPNAFGKEHLWPNKVKKRELLLDDVGVSSSGHPGTLSGNAKGKRSERDREGKGNVSRNGASRPGRPAGGNAKGERKSKVKPKQRTTQLSTFNGQVDTSPEQPRAIFPSASRSNDNTTDNNIREKDDFCLLDDPELQLPGIDVEIGAQGQDLGSWLNIDDEGLQEDLDFMGLEIPMDDLANINMMV